MKKSVVIAIMLVLVLNVYSQERTKAPIYKFDKVGKIINQKDAPKFTYNEVYKSWTEEKKHPFDFKSIQFKKVIVKNNSYYVLITNSVRDGYRYENIKQGYYVINKNRALIFSELEYNKIRNYTVGVSEFREIEDFENEKDLLYKTVFNIENIKEDGGIDRSELFVIKKENENLIRFNFSSDCCFKKKEELRKDGIGNWYFEISKDIFDTFII